MIIKAVVLGYATCLMIACNEKKEEPSVKEVQALPPIDKEQIKQDIQAKEDAFAATYNSGTLKEIGYYADDATSFFQNREPLVGKQAILAFLQSDLNENTNKITFKTMEIFPSADGSMVVEIGAFTVVDSLNTTVNKGNYMTLFEKRGDKYVAVRDMSTSDGTIR